MWTRPENDQFVEEVFLAGEVAPAGTYRQVGAIRRVVLDDESRLPGSLDGRVACYVRLDHSWEAMSVNERRSRP